MFKSMINRGSAALFLIALGVSTTASASVVIMPDFSGFASGALTPLSYVDNSGVTVSFSSPDGVFSITPTFFQSIDGNALFDTGQHFYTLQIDFSSPIDGFVANFALDTSGTGNLFATADLSGVQVGTASASGTVPGGAFTFAEGTLDVNVAGGFDRLVLTSDIGDYALGSAPEPASIALALAGLAALVAFKRRRAA
jgi:hypothetical protein